MTASQEHGLVARVAEAWPMSGWCDSHVLLAVSGGPDSVALLRAMLDIKHQCGGSGSVYVAHLNHGWRGSESDADEAWVAALCQKLGVPLTAARANNVAIAAADGEGFEAAARKARYDFLTSAAEKLGARYVAVAHTADDQVETVLHRMLRGTGMEGLAGMPFTRPLSPSVAVVRPLLSAFRSEVLAYLAAIGQDYRTDSTNADARWTRNRLRHELLPTLRKRFNANVDEAILRLAAQASETQVVVSQLAKKLAEACVYIEPSTAGEQFAAHVVDLTVDCRLLADQPPLLVREVCKVAWKRAGWPMQSMGYDEWRQLGELVQDANQAPVTFPANIRASRDKDVLYLQRAI